eukprot:TRINITY_DN4413_c0_g1_i1.p1 TRINITY_DN4413_c0_g1~~TRINITY_DN4413_c0_g1_i1.p1  ORF type:complete len:549 (+),score=127.97 TRINITY_DN4413_c0_g1_i1:156-1802(+)
MDFSELLRSLSFKNDRTFLLQLEKEFASFIQKHESESSECLPFPSMSGHYRWLIHALSEHFGLRSHSTGWGYDRATQVVRAEISKAPLLLLDDFVPVSSDSPLLNEGEISDWLAILARLRGDRELREDAQIRKVSTANSPQAAVATEVSGVSEEKKADDKKRKRPAFAAPYVPKGRRTELSAAEPSQILSGDTSSQNASETQNPAPRRVRGRGAFSFGKSETEASAMAEQAISDDMQRTGEKTNDRERPVETEKAPEEKEVVKIPTKFDYLKYSAETTRAKEDKKKQYLKSHVEIPKGKTGCSFSDAWKLSKSGDAVLEFKTKAEEFGVVFASARHGPDAKTFELAFALGTDGHYQVFLREKSGDILAKGRVPVVVAADMSAFWVSVRSGEVAVGCGTFNQNETFRYRHPTNFSAKFFGFEDLGGKGLTIKNIHIRKGVCEVAATRLHLLEIKKVKEDERTPEEIFGSENVQKFVHVDSSTLLAVMDSVRASFLRLKRFSPQEDLPLAVTLIEESDSKTLAEFAVNARPETNAQPAKRILTGALGSFK